MADLDQWGRRLKLKIHFKDQDNHSNLPAKKNWQSRTKKWTPTTEKVLEEYIEKTKKDIIAGLSR